MAIMGTETPIAVTLTVFGHFRPYIGKVRGRPAKSDDSKKRVIEDGFRSSG